ncbi:uncharacterized protein [Watersipora subatra]|uniref:uncharacterized protein n=1 Tax=Watersipora subatra TaxID=2589382 RepID=UPI00355C735E
MMMNSKTLMDRYHEALKSHYKKGMNTKEIAASIGVTHGIWRSVRTTQRHLNKLGLVNKGVESSLDTIIFAIKEIIYSSDEYQGYVAIWKTLRKEFGLLVRRKTVIDILSIIDAGRATRPRRTRIKRRVHREANEENQLQLQNYLEIDTVPIWVTEKETAG